MRSSFSTKLLLFGPLILGLLLTALLVFDLEATTGRDRTQADEHSARLLQSITGRVDAGLRAETGRVERIVDVAVLGSLEGSVDSHLRAVDAFGPSSAVRAVYLAENGFVRAFTRDGVSTVESLPRTEFGLGELADSFGDDRVAYAVEGRPGIDVVVVLDRADLTDELTAVGVEGITVHLPGLPGEERPRASTEGRRETEGMFVDPNDGSALVVAPTTFLGTALTVEVVAEPGSLLRPGPNPTPLAVAVGVLLSVALAGATSQILRSSRAEAERDRAVAGRDAAIARFRAGFSHAPIGVAELDPEGRILAVNQRFARQLGYAAEELRGWDVLDVLDPEDRTEAAARLESVRIGARDSVRGERRYRSRNGAAVWVRESVSPLATETGARHFLVQAEDISDQRRARAEAHRKALFDGVTGLPNRANLLARLNRAVESDRRPGELLAVLLVDLDEFRNVNDAHGHDVGDQLLIEVGERLRRVCRSSDTVARLGGDEFVVVCEGLPDEQVAGDTARRFVEALRDPMWVEDVEIPISASIGLVVNGERLSPDEILEQAGTAMRRAKSSGRDRLVRYDVVSIAPTEAPEGPDLSAGELSDAIENGHLRLFYQPIVTADALTVCGFEALVRWDHPVHGLLGPPQFLGLAEEHELLESLDAWVLGEGVAALARWSDADPQRSSWYLIFNVGPRNFEDREFATRVKGVLDEFGIDPARIVLERNETWFMTQTPSAVLTTRELRSMGVKISLDHFGTASASLGEMATIEFDFLKIDRSFVRDAHAQTNYVLEAMKNMADALGLRAIIEGVETESELRAVRRSGIELVQGFFVGRPVPETGIPGMGVTAAGAPASGA